MVIDTSVLIALALNEPTRDRLLIAMGTGSERVLSSVSLLETGIILRARFFERGTLLLNGLLDELISEVVAFDEVQAKSAIVAFGRFGKGMGHRAQLNFGDCAVYALAASRRDAVLATGRDFAATDLSSVPY